MGLRVDSQASPLTKCCELDVNSVSYLWRVVDSERPTLCRVIKLTKVITDSQHFVRRLWVDSESQWKQALSDAFLTNKMSCYIILWWIEEILLHFFVKLVFFIRTSRPSTYRLSKVFLPNYWAYWSHLEQERNFSIT